MVSFAVRAFLLRVAAEKALLCNAPHDVALRGAGAVWPQSVGACWFSVVLAHCVAPSTATLSSASGPTCVNSSTQCHTPASLVTSFSSFRTTLSPFYRT